MPNFLGMLGNIGSKLGGKAAAKAGTEAAAGAATNTAAKSGSTLGKKVMRYGLAAGGGWVANDAIHAMSAPPAPQPPAAPQPDQFKMAQDALLARLEKTAEDMAVLDHLSQVTGLSADDLMVLANQHPEEFAALFAQVFPDQGPADVPHEPMDDDEQGDILSRLQATAAQAQGAAPGTPEQVLDATAQDAAPETPEQVAAIQAQGAAPVAPEQAMDIQTQGAAPAEPAQAVAIPAQSMAATQPAENAREGAGSVSHNPAGVDKTAGDQDIMIARLQKSLDAAVDVAKAMKTSNVKPASAQPRIPDTTKQEKEAATLDLMERLEKTANEEHHRSKGHAVGDWARLNGMFGAGVGVLGGGIAGALSKNPLLALGGALGGGVVGGGLGAAQGAAAGWLNNKLTDGNNFAGVNPEDSHAQANAKAYGVLGGALGGLQGAVQGGALAGGRGALIGAPLGALAGAGGGALGGAIYGKYQDHRDHALDRYEEPEEQVATDLLGRLEKTALNIGEVASTVGKGVKGFVHNVKGDLYNAAKNEHAAGNVGEDMVSATKQSRDNARLLTGAAAGGTALGALGVHHQNKQMQNNVAKGIEQAQQKTASEAAEEEAKEKANLARGEKDEKESFLKDEGKEIAKKEEQEKSASENPPASSPSLVDYAAYKGRSDQKSSSPATAQGPSGKQGLAGYSAYQGKDDNKSTEKTASENEEFMTGIYKEAAAHIIQTAMPQVKTHVDPMSRITFSYN